MFVNCVAYHRGQKQKGHQRPKAEESGSSLFVAAVASMVLLDIYLVYRFRKAGWM